MGLLLPLEHGFLSPYPYLQAITMRFCRGPFQKPFSSQSEINWTLSKPGARQLNPKNSLDQPQLTSLLYQQFDVLTFYHIRSSLTELMAISSMTLCIVKFCFDPPLPTPNQSFLFSLSPRGPNQFQYLVNELSCRISHNAQQC